MISRYEVNLAGVNLSSLDNNLLILDVQYSPLTFESKQHTVANLEGFERKDVIARQRDVKVTFELHIYDIAKRNEACQKINDWAQNGGVLKINDRAGQYLLVECSEFAEIESARNWTDPLEIVFTTTGVPYWLSNTAKTTTLTGKNTTGSLTLDGNTKEALVSVTATAQEAVSSFKATVGDRSIILKDLNIAAGQQIVIDYVDNRYLRIKANGKKVTMQPESSDNLKASCGKRTSLGIVANGKISAVFSARGLWL